MVATRTARPACWSRRRGAGVDPAKAITRASVRFDLHNTLVAAGPDFRKGVVDPLPSGNTDIAPTVLWILGIQPAAPMDGRVLTEALAIPGPKTPAIRS